MTGGSLAIFLWTMLLKDALGLLSLHMMISLSLRWQKCSEMMKIMRNSWTLPKTIKMFGMKRVSLCVPKQQKENGIALLYILISMILDMRKGMVGNGDGLFHMTLKGLLLSLNLRSILWRNSQSSLNYQILMRSMLLLIPIIGKGMKLIFSLLICLILCRGVIWQQSI